MNVLIVQWSHYTEYERRELQKKEKQGTMNTRRAAQKPLDFIQLENQCLTTGRTGHYEEDYPM